MKSGFTLMEVIVCIIIIGILGMIVVAGVSKGRQQEALKNDIREYTVTKDNGRTETVKANGYDITPSSDVLFYMLENQEGGSGLDQRIIRTYSKGTWKDVKESGQD